MKRLDSGLNALLEAGVLSQESFNYWTEYWKNNRRVNGNGKRRDKWAWSKSKNEEEYVKWCEYFSQNMRPEFLN